MTSPYPKRLQRLQRLVSNQCFQLQVSCITPRCIQSKWMNWIQKIEKIINRHHDDVRIYETYR